MGLVELLLELSLGFFEADALSLHPELQLMQLVGRRFYLSLQAELVKLGAQLLVVNLLVPDDLFEQGNVVFELDDDFLLLVASTLCLHCLPLRVPVRNGLPLAGRLVADGFARDHIDAVVCQQDHTIVAVGTLEDVPDGADLSAWLRGARVRDDERHRIPVFVYGEEAVVVGPRVRRR